MATQQMIVQATVLGPSLLPKDSFENVWHFVGDAATPMNDYASAASQVALFYCQTLTPNTAPLSDYLSKLTNRSVNVKVYNEADGTRGTGSKRLGTYIAGNPRPIRYEATTPMPNPGGTTALPEEVSVTLSYYAGSNTPRNRGRLYIGPLAGGAMEQDADPRPSAAFLTVLTNCASAIQAQGTGPGTPVPPTGTTVQVGSAQAAATTTWWAVKSKMGGLVRAPGVVSYEAVTAGFVTNEWSVQHRRRIAASARVLW
jgi:hypothetical protein